MLLSVLVIYVLDIALFAFSVSHVETAATPLSITGPVISILVFFTAWIFLCGLR